MPSEGCPHSKGRNRERKGDDPQRRRKSSASETERVEVLSTQQCNDENGRKGSPVEKTLQWIRRPDDSDDQAVCKYDLEEIAVARRIGYLCGRQSL
jgi:hypothetical protein